MKILYIIPEYHPDVAGGISRYYQELLPEMARLGHEINVLIGSAVTSTLPSYEANGIRVDYLNDSNVASFLGKFDRYQALPNLHRHLAAAWAAWKQMEAGKQFDVVETTDWGLLFVPWVIRSNDIPVIVTMHGSIGQLDYYNSQVGEELQGELVRCLEIGLLQHADGLHASNSTNAEAWRKLIGRELNVIPLALKCELKQNRASTMKQRGLAAGRLQYCKGPIILCEALRLLGKSAPEINWIGSDMPYEKSGSSMSAYLAKKYPDIWNIKLHYLGAQNYTSANEMQKRADFILVPSFWDVFNYSCVEGMMHAKVVICSQGAGASELIKDGVNGLKYISDDPEALAAKIKQYHTMDTLAQEEMGEYARQTIIDNLSPGRIAGLKLQNYRELIKNGKCTIRPNVWLTKAFSPSDQSVGPLSFLDYLPLRKIIRYALMRTFKKIMAIKPKDA